eukprot:TRINITY_DN15493_c0_g3_i1.p1 TRINITY_DN15493_c0_g3~~TRINITY_DN15493_c0_g3_i1.p1  ORF type:complete len:402 (-),score=62.07 TRINITY_DN15493_c0_g3_i1:47-1111(-)
MTGWCGGTSMHCSCWDCIDYALSNSSHASPLFPDGYRVQARPSAAVLILARLNSFISLRKLARLLRGFSTCKWLARRGAPIVVFFDSPIYSACEAGLGTFECERLLGQWGDFVRFVNITDIFVAPEGFRSQPSVLGFPLSYAVMCEFWASKVFDLDEVKDLKYYMRLDDDATMVCDDDSPDPFRILEERRANYGYYVLARERPDLDDGFREHLQDYLASSAHSSAAEAQAVSAPAFDMSDGVGAPVFYNNFEVVDVQYFRGELVQRYTESALATGGIYRHRWGDALFRYAQLLVGKGSALCLSAVYSYCHQACCSERAGGRCTQPLGGCGGIDRDAENLRILSPLRWPESLGIG